MISEERLNALSSLASLSDVVEEIRALRKVYEAGKVTCDAIFQMKNGLISSNSTLGKFLNSGPVLKEAIADYERGGEK